MTFFWQESEAALAEAKKAYEEAKKAAADAQDKADKLGAEYDIISGRLETVDLPPLFEGEENIKNVSRYLTLTGWPRKFAMIFQEISRSV